MAWKRQAVIQRVSCCARATGKSQTPHPYYIYFAPPTHHIEHFEDANDSQEKYHRDHDDEYSHAALPRETPRLRGTGCRNMGGRGG